MYMDQRIHKTSAFYGTLGMDETSHWLVNRVEHPRSPVYILLYLNRENHKHRPCSYVAGRADVPLSQLATTKDDEVSLHFVDEHGEHVANASFHLVADADALAGVARPLQSPQLFLGPTAARVQTWKPAPPPEPRFPGLSRLVNYYTPTFVSPRTPKWMLALTGLESETDPTQEAYWEALAKNTCQVLSISEEDFVHAPHRHAEVLGQVVGWVGWHAPYLADGTFVGDDLKMTGDSALALHDRSITNGVVCQINGDSLVRRLSGGPETAKTLRAMHTLAW
jgi:hypothetical protein